MESRILELTEPVIRFYVSVDQGLGLEVHNRTSLDLDSKPSTLRVESWDFQAMWTVEIFNHEFLSEKSSNQTADKFDEEI